MFYQIVNPVITGISTAKPADAPAIFAKLFAGIVGLFLIIATLYAFIQLLIGGLNYITSGGDKAQVEAAQQRIQYAIIGLFVVFAAWGIFLLLLQFFGMSPVGGGLQIKFPTLF
jgi:hypothetical protein